MKINIWTYFINGIAAVVALIGVIAMATTYKNYDNYIIARDDYKFFKTYNSYKANLSTQERTELNNVISAKFNGINTVDKNVSKFTLDTVDGFEKFSDYSDFLTNKETSFIYSKAAIDQINKNVISLESAGLESIKNTIKTNYNKNSYYIELDKFIYRQFNNVYHYNKSPEGYSMFAGIAFLTIGTLTSVAYFGAFIYSVYKKNKLK